MGEWFGTFFGELSQREKHSENKSPLVQLIFILRSSTWIWSSYFQEFVGFQIILILDYYMEYTFMLWQPFNWPKLFIQIGPQLICDQIQNQKIVKNGQLMLVKTCSKISIQWANQIRKNILNFPTNTKKFVYLGRW